MKRLSLLTLFFSIAFLLFFLAPPFLNQAFAPYPLINVADVLDLFTPIVLIPLYWLIFRLDGKSFPTLGENLFFVVFVAIWVLGQGMHLAANSIGHLLEEMKGTDVFRLGHFYDEVLSHYIWHFGIIGLSAVLIYRQWRNPPAEDNTANFLPILAGIIYGFTFFALIIEGATAPLGVTFTVLAVIFLFVSGRKAFKQRPVLLFFVVAYLLALLLFTGWGIYWQGLPEFSEVGLI